MAKQKRDIYQEVTDRIIEAIEAGTLPWLKPWKDGSNADPSMPYNADTGRAYSGINVILLMCEASQYNSQGWMTYNQAKKRGAQVMKGEKGTQVTLFKPCKGTNKTTGEAEAYFLLRAFTVFNVDQIDWSAEGCKPPALPVSPLPTETHFDSLAASVGCDLRVQGNRACYIPSADQVHMPHHDQFKSTDEYNSTGYHELGHWTGHTSRMDRMANFGKRFGDEAYAFEELVAELSSAFLCAQTGVKAELRHDSYIASWLKVLKDDKKAIFTASSQARQANEWLIANSTLAALKEDLAA
jgi:antirestriction protein ArdC